MHLWALTFDLTVNLTAIISACLTGIVTYFGRTLVGYVRDLTYRLDVLWSDYEKRHPEEFHEFPGRDRRKHRRMVVEG